MKSVLLTTCAALVLLSCASSTPKVKQSSVNFDNAVTPDGEKLICVSEKTTGTRIKTKTCMTKAEKEAARKKSEDFINNLKRSPGVIKGASPNSHH